MQQVVLASNNQGKLAEFEQLFMPLDMTVIPQKALGISDVAENGLSFVENALIKARHASAMANLPAIADDSGLCVPVLDDAPGIYSARFAAKQLMDSHLADNDKVAIDKASSDQANNELLLKCLKPYHDKGETVSAFFVCVLVLVRHKDDPLPLIAQGQWVGEIIAQGRGQHGFGYDPIFWLPSLQKTAAELDKTIKNQLSHRAMAMAKLQESLAQGV